MIAKKYKTGLTFGVFDMYHPGHVALLRNASELCEELVVCLSSDEYCREKKGKNPVMSWTDRAIVLSSVKYVSYIDVQGLEFTKADAIKLYDADVLFVGDDWTPETYSGEGLGVPVIYLPHTPDISSSMIRERLRGA